MYLCKTLLSCSSTQRLFQRPNLTCKKLEGAIVAIFLIGSIVAISLSFAEAAGLSSGWMEAGVLTSRAIVLITGTGVLGVLGVAALKRCIGHHTGSSGSIPSVKAGYQGTDPVKPSVEIPLPLGHKDTNQIEVFGKAAYLQANIEIEEQEPPLPKIDTGAWPNFNPEKFAWVWIPTCLTYNHLIQDTPTIQHALRSFHAKDQTLSSPGWQLITRELLGTHTINSGSYCEACKGTANLPRWSQQETHNFSVGHHNSLMKHLKTTSVCKQLRRPYALEALVMSRLCIAQGLKGYTICVERQCRKIRRRADPNNWAYACVMVALTNTMKSFPFLLKLNGTRTEGEHDGHIDSLLVIEF